MENHDWQCLSVDRTSSGDDFTLIGHIGSWFTFVELVSFMKVILLYGIFSFFFFFLFFSSTAYIWQQSSVADEMGYKSQVPAKNIKKNQLVDYFIAVLRVRLKPFLKVSEPRPCSVFG